MGVLSPFVRKIKDKRGSLKYTSVLFIRSIRIFILEGY